MCAVERGNVTVRRVAALDGLRGAAVAGVLLFHGGHLIGGYLGVDLFFVLSGFLITSLLLAETERSSQIGLGQFWARRARRLLPALAGLLAGVAVYCIVFAAPSELAQIRGDAIATVGYVANWRAVFAGQDYWALFSAPSPLQHTWSLAIEEQFYLVWPLVVVGLLAWWKRSTPMAVLVLALLGAAASAIWAAVLYDPLNVSRVYYGTDTRVEGILLGAAFAAALSVWGPVRGRTARVVLEGVGIAGVVVLVLAWTRVDGQSAWLYRGGLLGCGLAVVAVIAAASHPEAGPLSWVLSFRPLCLLGLISYGVYLWHWPIYIVLDEHRTGLSGWALLGVRVSATLVIAIASYFIIEQPVRRGAGSRRTWLIATPALVVGVMLLVGVATLGAVPAGAEKSAALATLARQAKAAPPGTTKTMVVGDSVGFYLGVGMTETAPPGDLVLNRAHIACGFPPGAQAEQYSGTFRVLMDPIPCDTDWSPSISKLRPDVVAMVFWIPGDAKYKYGGYWMQPCDANYDRMYRARLTEAVDRFTHSGAAVVITNGPYGFYDVSQPQNRRRIDCVNRVVADVAGTTGAHLIDLRRFVCPKAPTCLATMNGQILRPDGVHFKGPGGQIVARWLNEQIARATAAKP